MEYLLQNGTKVNNLNNINETFYIYEMIRQDGNIDYGFNGDDTLYSIDSECVRLYDAFQDKIFPDREKYYLDTYKLPIFINQGGHDSDSAISKDWFGKFLEPIQNEEINKHLYLQDCQTMISSVQNLVQSINWNFIYFYKFLSETNIAGGIVKDGVFWSMSPQGNLVYTVLDNFIISTYSIFDMLTKIAFELENLSSDYSKYCKLRSSKKLYGDKKHLNSIDFKNTVFEDSTTVNTIINLRNELVHNASWEQHPKVFINIQQMKIAERFILLPDMNNGYIDTFVNRKRFFSQGIKVNDILPHLYMDILNRIHNTLLQLNGK